MREAWLAGLGIVAVASFAGADEWSRRYPLQGRADLHVKVDDGSVRIETSEGATEIAALVTTLGWRIGEDEVRIVESQSGNRVDVEVRLPRERSWSSMGNRQVRVVLQVPRSADVDVRTGDGSVDVQPVSGRVHVSTGDGSITADGLQGDISLHTGDGSIRAIGLAGRLKADTGDGSVNVRGRFDALDLSTGDGGIDAEAEAGSKVQAPWSLSSGDGGITLGVPGDLAADVDLHAGDGNIDLDAPLTVTGSVTRSRVKGKLGAGGQPLRLQTGDGSIRLRRF